jgi:hypothetical protein
MSALPGRQRRWPIIEAVSKWWRDWISGYCDVKCCGAEEVERLAKEIGVSASEFRNLASRGPDSADLLLRRMAALGLDRDEVSRTEPRTFQDLQRVCTLCRVRRRCSRDFARDSADPAWEHYCMNAATLIAWIANLGRRGASDRLAGALYV